MGISSVSVDREAIELKKFKLCDSMIIHSWVDIGVILLPDVFNLLSEKLSFGNIEYMEVIISEPSNEISKYKIDKCFYVKETNLLNKDVISHNYAEIYKHFGFKNIILYFNENLEKI